MRSDRFIVMTGAAMWSLLLSSRHRASSSISAGKELPLPQVNNRSWSQGSSARMTPLFFYAEDGLRTVEISTPKNLRSGKKE
jgi:hypothetical protein